MIVKSHSKNFLNRPRRVPGGINPDPMRAKMLGNLPVPEWRSTRKVLSKSFSSRMMRSFEPKINALIDDLMDKVSAISENSGELDMYELFQNFTFELISNTGFGVHANFIGNKDLKASVDEEFSKSPTSFLTKQLLRFPELANYMQPIRIFNQWFKTTFRKVKSTELKKFCLSALQQRLHANECGNDILQVMLDSPICKDLEKVTANSILIYEAGFETLSAGLAFTLHLLTVNQDVQLLVRDEIRTYLRENGGQIFASNISQLTYLHLVIKESLRMYPPQTTFISRY